MHRFIYDPPIVQRADSEHSHVATELRVATVTWHLHHSSHPWCEGTVQPPIKRDLKEHFNSFLTEAV